MFEGFRRINTFFLVVLIAAYCITLGEGHGRLLQPPQRSSLWRDSRFPHAERNYDDAALWCGGTTQEYYPKNCGFCGDPASESKPRANENGGTYGKGTIGGRYKKGQVIDVGFEFTTMHHGSYSVQLCDNVVKESEACFWERGFLPMTGARTNGTAFDATDFKGRADTKVTLPKDLTCKHCVLRIYYRAAKDWGWCADGTGKKGCGPQEIVLNCADIEITQ